MDRILQNLISILRNSGVRISVAESLDAMNAVSLMGYGDREVLEDSLAATLAKSQQEKETFEDCFQRFFSLENPPESESEVSFAESELECFPQDSKLTRMMLSGDTTELSLLMRESAEQVKVNEIMFFTQKGLYIRRILMGMGLEGLDRDIQYLSLSDSRSSREKAILLQEARDLLFEHVRNFVERQFSLFAGSVTEEIIERYLRSTRLSNLEERDFDRMRTIIQKMVKRLNDLHSRRKKILKRGCLDLKKTLRANLAYDGILCDLRWKDQKKTLRANLAYDGILCDLRWKDQKVDRPDIVAICDVSRSVQAVARFMLLFLYSLNKAVARIRSFIFCSNLVEVTHVFDAYPVEEALVMLQKGIGLGILLGPTDYGRSFLDFKRDWLDTVTNKTTVIILGDARNNYGDPQIDALHLIHERSKLLIWLNPETPSFWGTGDSEMKRYSPYCSVARECSTVNHLERVVDYLLRTRG